MTTALPHADPLGPASPCTTSADATPLDAVSFGAMSLDAPFDAAPAVGPFSMPRFAARSPAPRASACARRSARPPGRRATRTTRPSGRDEARRMVEDPTRAAILTDADLPGPLGIASLTRMGALVRLDESACYLAHRASTVPGRASIAELLLPPDAVACSSMARWIWSGGEFPAVITVISKAHMRSTVFGRRMKAYDRRLTADERSRLGGMWVTSPVRTACDLACDGPDVTAHDDDCDDGCAGGARRDAMRAKPCAKCGARPTTKPGTHPGPDEHEHDTDIDVTGLEAAAIVELMEDYRFTPDDCLAMIGRNKRWPGRARGIATLNCIRDAYAMVEADADGMPDAFAAEASPAHATAPVNATATASSTAYDGQEHP